MIFKLRDRTATTAAAISFTRVAFCFNKCEVTRPEDTDRNAAIGRMLTSKQSWGEIQSVTGCSRATIAKIAKRLKTGA